MAPTKKTRHAKKTPRIKPTTKPPEEDVVTVVENFTCSTPKGREFRIPMLDTCPAAPMKRGLWRSDDVRAMKKAEEFTNPPDVEIFFMLVENSQS